jgi:hypothetical protein
VLRTALKRGAFQTLVEHARETRRNREDGRLDSVPSKNFCTPSSSEVYHPEDTTSVLRGLVQRQARLAESQEAKIRDLRERWRSSRELADQRELQVARLLRHVEAQECALRELRGGPCSCSGGEGVSEAEQRLLRSMRMLENGLLRSGAIIGAQGE